jgi:hypothetical protein
VKTEIEYLRELEENLMAVARREAEPVAVATATRPHRPSRWRRVSVRAMAASVAAFLAVAGGIGYLATNGSSPTAVTGTAREALQGRFLPADVAPTHSFSAHAAPSPAATSAPGGPTGATGPGAVPPASGGQGQIVGPNVIKNAELSVRVAKGAFDQQYGMATEIAGSNGGYVAASSVENGKTDSGTVTIRVPADHFEAALNELRALGHVDRESVSGQDVTARFVDLAARLRNAQDKVIVLRRLLAKAPTVAATLRVSNALSSAELQVEELQGAIRALQNRTDLGTIQLTLYERAPRQNPPPTTTHRTIGGAWRHAVKGFFGVVYSVVVGLGYLVPITVLLALVALLIWLGVRRARDRVAA